MDLNELWQKALKNTEIIRTRVQALMTFSETRVPYILLSESSINLGDTVVRKGEVIVEKPTLFLPPNIPQFEGFDFKEEPLAFNENSFVNFLFVRGISLPSLKYSNTTHSLDIFEQKLSEAIRHYREILIKQENVHTGLIAAPEDCWQFSLLIFICSQIFKNADTDIKKLLERYRKNDNHDKLA